MDCEWLERLSRLIDGELDDDEAARVGEHLLTCPTCGEARNEFLLLGKALREVPSGADAFAARRAEHAVTRVPSWRRPIPVPVPLFAGLIALILALGGLAAVRRGSPPTRAPAATSDLASLDRGERASIHIVKRSVRP
jgi:anti-sigma factor RsiW